MKKTILLILLPFALAFATPGFAQEIYQWATPQKSSPNDLFSGLQKSSDYGDTVAWSLISQSTDVYTYNVVWDGDTPVLTTQGEGSYNFSCFNVSFTLTLVNGSAGSGLATLVFTWTINGIPSTNGLSQLNGRSGNQTITVNKSQASGQGAPGTGTPATGNGGGTGGGTSGGGSVSYDGSDYNLYSTFDGSSTYLVYDSSDNIVGQATYDSEGIATTVYGQTTPEGQTGLTPAQIKEIVDECRAEG